MIYGFCLTDGFRAIIIPPHWKRSTYGDISTNPEPISQFITFISGLAQRLRRQVFRFSLQTPAQVGADGNTCKGTAPQAVRNM